VLECHSDPAAGVLTDRLRSSYRKDRHPIHSLQENLGQELGRLGWN
ncbi:uncharacterized protein METZ01_LOCUS194303, partial [marine metagenome]